MKNRSDIILMFPKKMYTIESYLELYPGDSKEDAEKWLSLQKDKVLKIAKKIREAYSLDELTDREVEILMEYQINNCLEYNNNAKKVAPYKNVRFILDEIENDSDYFHNVTKIGKLLGFNNREMISFACKYSKCLIWDELLQFAEKSEIDSSIAQKIKKINRINSKVKGNLNLKMINEWDGQLTSLEFDQHIDSKVFTGYAAQQKDFSLAFYKYNEELLRIKPDGNLFYSSVEGLGHPLVARIMYKNELDLGEDVGNGVEIYKKAVQNLNDITILGAGEHPSIFLPEELTINQKKMLYKLLQNCNKETPFKIAVVFIDKNGEFKEPLYIDEYGDLSSIESINSFIDLYLGRYSTQEIPVFLEKDLQLNQQEREESINL